MAFSLTQSVPSTLSEDTTQTGPSPSISLVDSNGVDFTLTADGDKLVVDASAGASSIVMNEAGADVDFRVEGDTDANLIWVDASSDGVSMGTSTAPSAKLMVKGAANSWAQKVLGSGTTSQDFGLKVTAGTNSSDVAFHVSNSADTVDYFEVKGDGAVVVNESGADADFRVEGDTDTSLLLVDAGLDGVAIGGAAVTDHKFVVRNPNDATDNPFAVYNDNGNQQLLVTQDSSGNGILQVKSNAGTVSQINTNGNSYFMGGNVGIGEAAPTTKLHVDSGTGLMKFGEVTLADDASVALETNFGSGGILTIVENLNYVAGQANIRSSANDVIIVASGAGTFVNTDTDTKVCILADLDGTYSLKNRLGSSVTFIIQYIGV